MNQFEPAEIAKIIIHETGSNLFLTGKAGTGKTTLLKEIIQDSPKNLVILAPTGVAAMNAGGMTIHSFFQLPFSTYIKPGANGAVSKYMLLKNLRFSDDKIELIKNLQLIIIDEISMVRADVIDAIDDILRHVRNKANEPFGGAQMLFIGDLFQLPPVVKDDEMALLSQFYASPFFFEATVMKLAPFKTIELNKIYRQQDIKFIDLLNKIRNNECENSDFELMKSLRKSMPNPIPKGTIILSSHNYQSEAINKNSIDVLAGQSYSYKASFSGNFNERNVPGELELELKVGAQVMFTKNDSSGLQKYYNGKIAVISKLEKDSVFVSFDDEEEFEVSKENWTNHEYVYDADEDRIQKKELGKFTQYPLKLAWAITIHKSQGLTFNEVLIDAGKSFAAGQVYVALSRCTSLNGLGLLSEISPSNIISDRNIVNFLKKQTSPQDWIEELELEKRMYSILNMNDCFAMYELIQIEKSTISQLQKLAVFEHETFGKNWKKIQNMILHLDEMAEKFKQLINFKFREENEDIDWISQKILGAKRYFIKELGENGLEPLVEIKTDVSSKKRIKGLNKILDKFKNQIIQKRKKIAFVTMPGMKLSVEIPSEKTVVKPGKGESKLITHDMFVAGMKVPEIAKSRNMAESTIEGHLSELVVDGMLDYKLIISDEEIQKINQVKEEKSFEGLKPLFDEFNGTYTYSKLRIAVQLHKKLQELS